MCLPSTDNALESVNGTIKSIFTLREILPVNQYLASAVAMLRDWSRDREGVKPFCDGIDISDKCWQMAYRALTTDWTIARVGPSKSNRFVLYNIADQALKSTDFLLSKFAKLSVNFDQLVELHEKFARVDLNRDDWTASRCSCQYFLKNYFCFHIIAIASNEKLTTISDIHKNVPIGQKAKRGKKPKAKKPLFANDLYT